MFSSEALTKFESIVLGTIIQTQLFGVFSNIICIYIVRRMKTFYFTNRPKILMANIALTDTILILVSIFPRFVIIGLIKDSSITTAYVTQSLRNYLENLALFAEAFTMLLIAWDRYTYTLYN